MLFKLQKPRVCVECGNNNAVCHPILYVDLMVANIFNYLFADSGVTNWLRSKIRSSENRITSHFVSVCIHLGLAKKKTEIDDKISLLARMLWDEAKKRGIVVWEFRLFDLPRNIFVAEFPNGKIITYEGIPVPSRFIHEVWWIDDKAVLKKYFQRLGIPVAKGGAVFTKRGAVELFETLNVPVIVKPRSGSGSRHTTLHITNASELLRAFSVAVALSPMAIIEEELVGRVYRATVVDGKLVATLRRDQPYVVGDGESTIELLVNEANKHPARSGPYFSKIKIFPALIFPRYPPHFLGLSALSWSY